MKKIILSLAFVLTFSLVSFSNEKSTETINENLVKIEKLANDVFYHVNIIYDAFDICTITVTIRYSNGNSYSATASNNKGNCEAAEAAALSAAQELAAFFEGP